MPPVPRRRGTGGFVVSGGVVPATPTHVFSGVDHRCTMRDMARSPVTVPTAADPVAFLDAVPDPVRRRDGLTLLELHERATGQAAVMWGPAIVGFGSYHYAYDSGREGDAPAAGFSPRAAASTVYFPFGFDDLADDLAALGPHRVSVSCLYLKDLTKVDLDVLERLVARSYARVMKSR
jgi:hypothetical protein